MRMMAWLYLLFGVLAAVLSLFSAEAQAAPLPMSAGFGFYIQGVEGEQPPDTLEVPDTPPPDWSLEPSEPEPVPEVEPEESGDVSESSDQQEEGYFEDWGPALPGDPRYTTPEEMELAEQYQAGLPLGYSGVLGSPDQFGGSETELSVLQEIRDFLGIFYALALFGFSCLVVRLIIRAGLTTFTRHTGL